MSSEAPDVYKEAQQHAQAYLDGLREAYVQISQLIGYASIGDVLYTAEDGQRMARHKEALEALLGDTAFNAKGKYRKH